MSLNSQLPWTEPTVIAHSQRLCQSFHHWTGRHLVAPGQPATERCRCLYEAAFAVLSHGLEPDPLLNYGNRAALELWQMDWQDFTQMPSRLTAEPLERQQRDRLLAEAASQGYISGYQGVRISSAGRRFQIFNALIWDVLDPQGEKLGQAAMFDRWQWLDQETYDSSPEFS